MAVAFTDIPVVDLGPMTQPGPARDQLVEEVRRICHEVGFLVVVNHGIDEEFVASVFEMMEQFFAFDRETKLLIDKRNSRHFRGWEDLGAEQTNNKPDIREQIDLWSEWPALAPDVEPEYLRLLGPNQWLPNGVLDSQQPLVQQWFRVLGELADQILGLLSLGLGLAEDHLAEFFGAQPMSLTKLISYPPTPAGQAGVNAHHDTGFLTVLATGDTPGLEVQNPEGEWVPVPIVPNSFVINLGEMLQAMTGNYFVATPHRVISSTRRLSAGYFHGPSLDAEPCALPLDESFARAVEASDRHRGAGFMTSRHETESGVAAMGSSNRPDSYGQQLWNYFARSYPANMAHHY